MWFTITEAGGEREFAVQNLHDWFARCLWPAEAPELRCEVQ